MAWETAGWLLVSAWSEASARRTPSSAFGPDWLWAAPRVDSIWWSALIA